MTTTPPPVFKPYRVGGRSLTRLDEAVHVVTRVDPPAEPRGSRLPAWLALLRPRQWVKNAFVPIAPLAVDPAAVVRHPGLLAAAVLAFVAASSAVYVLNDWLDRERDRLHATKRHRPIASGRVGPVRALLLGVGCLAALGAAAVALPPTARLAVAAYLVLNLLYCLVLKHHALVDISVVAFGFVLRAAAGCLAVAAPFSPTMIVCVYCVCLLLSLGKRRHELAAVTRAGEAAATRPALAGYSVPLLDQLMAVLVGSTLISYLLHLLEPGRPQGALLAVVTLPFAVFALARYLQLVTVDRRGGEPGRDVLRDLPLLINAALWLLCLAAGRLF
ncbi:UbiA prenyltransferase family protein [Saccharothrix syringae]|uniref:Prenyltransferase n=1 Tax=Saccharothrix syringae TaxID=103733 RepID=A0A5Q0GZ37_SACSY|nr:UbiA prenyltransferase family protein [Saccharothrix syringae]QFZ18794.1 prenyltransferase [Saccharothrix syringae]